jgi:hypothetical protein
MANLTELPGLLEEAAEHLRASRAPRDETFEELCFAVDLALAALYRFHAESQAREIIRGPAGMGARPSLMLVASRETPSRPGPSAKSHA